MRRALGSTADMGVRGLMALVVSAALLVAPFLSWRDFNDGGSAAGLAGIHSLYGLEFLLGGIVCSIMLLIRYFGDPAGWPGLTYAPAAVGVLALVPLFLSAVETNKLALLALVASPTLRISAGAGLLLGVAGDGALILLSVWPDRRSAPLDAGGQHRRLSYSRAA